MSAQKCGVGTCVLSGVAAVAVRAAVRTGRGTASFTGVVELGGKEGPLRTSWAVVSAHCLIRSGPGGMAVLRRARPRRVGARTHAPGVPAEAAGVCVIGQGQRLGLQPLGAPASGPGSGATAVDDGAVQFAAGRGLADDGTPSVDQVRGTQSSISVRSSRISAAARRSSARLAMRRALRRWLRRVAPRRCGKGRVSS